jgi:anti-sigma factor RsiW
VSCEPEQITAYVDAALDEAAHAELEAHLAECPDCREQAQFETALRQRLRELPQPEPAPELERRVRWRLRRDRPRGLRWMLPAAATLLLVLWGRGSAPFVAWELARDHDRCFSAKMVPAKLWSNDAHAVMAWFEQEGEPIPLVPDSVNGLTLLGARFCPLPSGAMAPHLYYASDHGQLSLFVVPHAVRFSGTYAVSARGNAVRLLRAGGVVVGIVGERPEDVDAFYRAFQTTVAWRIARAPR